MAELTGQRVEITGAGGGIGTAPCPVLAEAVASIVTCDIEGAALPEGARVRRFDLRDGTDVLRTAKAILGSAPSRPCCMTLAVPGPKRTRR